MSVKQTSELFDEELADQEVIKSLLSEIERINKMENFVVNEAGKLLKVGQIEDVALDEAKNLVTVLQEKLTTLQNWIASEEAKLNPVQETPAEAAPAPEVPAETPVETPEVPAVEATPDVPTEAPAEPADATPETPPLQ